ncbi:MAG TPA: hypothetical protein VEJ41_09820 [Candidatus Acidoferrales bacterium]|nr:hypothetical protein [Candidatus Acidoferrales bacterium]
MQIFGTSINVELGGFRVRFSFGLDDRAPDALTRVEDMPRLELTTRD